MNIRDIVEEEYAKRGLCEDLDNPEQKVVPHVMEIDVSSGKYEVLFRTGGSVQCFVLDTQKGSSYSGRLYLHLNHRDRGIGRKLVEIREEICKKVGIGLIFINNTNDNFWEYMGYKRIADQNWIQFWLHGFKKRLPYPNFSRYYFANARYKVLR